VEPNFIYIEKTAAEWCRARGIILVGLDYLTVDPPSEPTAPSHLILARNDIVILENILLRDVEPGRYTTSCRPG